MTAACRGAGSPGVSRATQGVALALFDCAARRGGWGRRATDTIVSQATLHTPDVGAVRWDVASTYHALPPYPIRWRSYLRSVALNTRRLLVPRQHNAYGPPRKREPGERHHTRQGGRWPVFVVPPGPRCQHAKSDKALAEEDGRGDYDQDQKDGELVVDDASSYREGKVYRRTVSSGSNVG